MNRKSIKLLSKKTDGNLQLNQAGLNFLRSINNDIGVCVCVGPYKEGKSFLLNQILNENPAFKLEHNDVNGTEGVWLSTNLIEIIDPDGKKFLMLLFDTEGLEKDISNSQWDLNLIIFSLLCSSLFIYNTKSTLNSSVLERLSLINILKDQIVLNDYQELTHKFDDIDTDITSGHPDFLWVARDYQLKRTKPARDILNQFLRTEKNTNNDFRSKRNFQVENQIEMRNKIRLNFKKSFNSLKCHYLPVPVNDIAKNMNFEQIVQKLDKIKFKDLRDQFKKSMTDLRYIVLDTIRPKQINKMNMTGPIFVDYLKLIVKQINSKNKIDVHDIFNSSLDGLAESILERVEHLYKKNLEIKINMEKPIETTKFYQENAIMKKKCCNSLKNQLSTLFPSRLSDFLRQFDMFCEYEFNKANESNNLNIYNFNKNVALNEWKKLNLSANQYSSIAEFESAINILNNNLRSKLVISKESDFNNVLDDLKKSKNFENVKNDFYKNLSIKYWAVQMEKTFENKENMKYKSLTDFEYAIDQFKRDLKLTRLHKLTTIEFDMNWKSLMDSINIERIKRELSSYFEMIKEKERIEIEMRNKTVKKTQFNSSLYEPSYYSPLGSSYSRPTFSFPTPSDSPLSNSNNSFSNNCSYEPEPSVHLCKNGQPDRRYSENRVNFVSSDGIRLNKDGRPDMRYGVNKRLFGSK